MPRVKVKVEAEVDMESNGDFNLAIRRMIRDRKFPAGLKITEHMDPMEKAIHLLKYGAGAFKKQSPCPRFVYQFAYNKPGLPKWTDPEFKVFMNSLARQATKVYQNGGGLIKTPSRIKVGRDSDGNDLMKTINYYRYATDENERQTHIVGKARLDVTRSVNRYIDRHQRIDQKKLSGAAKEQYVNDQKLTEQLTARAIQTHLNPGLLPMGMRNGTAGNPPPIRRPEARA